MTARTIEVKPIPAEEADALISEQWPMNTGPLTDRLRENRETQILDALPGQSQIDRERARLQKLQAELDAREQERLARYAAYESDIRKLGIFEADLARGQYHADGARQHIADVKATIRDWYFNGGHPQMGKDSRPYQSITLAAEARGAELVIQEFEAWRPEQEAKIEALRKSIAEQAKALGLDKLPAPAAESDEDYEPRKFRL